MQKRGTIFTEVPMKEDLLATTSRRSGVTEKPEHHLPAVSNRIVEATRDTEHLPAVSNRIVEATRDTEHLLAMANKRIIELEAQLQLRDAPRQYVFNRSMERCLLEKPLIQSVRIWQSLLLSTCLKRSFNLECGYSRRSISPTSSIARRQGWRTSPSQN
jgi:hypothetical protein